MQGTFGLIFATLAANIKPISKKGTCMYENWKRREKMAKIAAWFCPSKSGRRIVRDKIRFRDFIIDVGVRDFPVKKYSKPVDIAFCFNSNGVNIAAVAMRSLVDAANGACDYNIYCVVDREVTTAQRNLLKKNIAHTKSKITFLKANHDFDSACVAGGWPVAIWYRMMLPKLLPNVSKIIYADIDTIFFRDLVDISRIDMGHNYLAGVVERGKTYLNSGFLVMNLDQIRRDGLYEKWVAAAPNKNYKNPDQDMLNFSTYGRKIFLPLKYNFQTYLGAGIHTLYPESWLEDVRHNLVVMHFSNYIKPWGGKYRPIYSEYWWQVADKTGIYSKK